MKIYQGYKSKSMNAFPFLEMHKLENYTDKNQPLVVFGCYSKEDVDIIKNHKSTVVIQWEGLDSKNQKNLSIFKADNIINVTPHPNIVDYFNEKSLNCKLIKWAIEDTINPQVLGNKVYSYVNRRNPIYYGSELIDLLDIEHDFVIGNLNKLWNLEEKNNIYSQVFIGLQLCNYAGGGFGIVEMGLRGIPVITNVLSYANCIHWNDLEDIQLIIKEKSEDIGKINKDLAEEVYEEVLYSEKLECYDLKQLII